MYPNLVKENRRKSTLTGWTCKHKDLNRLCPKISPITVPIMFTIKCRVIITIWSHSPISFEHVIFMMFVFWSPPKRKEKEKEKITPVHCTSMNTSPLHDMACCVVGGYAFLPHRTTYWCWHPSGFPSLGWGINPWRTMQAPWPWYYFGRILFKTSTPLH